MLFKSSLFKLCLVFYFIQTLLDPLILWSVTSFGEARRVIKKCIGKYRVNYANLNVKGARASGILNVLIFLLNKQCWSIIHSPLSLVPKMSLGKVLSLMEFPGCLDRLYAILFMA